MLRPVISSALRTMGYDPSRHREYRKDPLSSKLNFKTFQKVKILLTRGQLSLAEARFLQGSGPDFRSKQADY